MLQQEATISTFRGEVLDMSLWYRDIKSVLLPSYFCLQAALAHTVSIGRHSNTLTRVTDNHWKISVSPSYDCTFSMTIVRTYHNFHVRTYKAQLVGAANVIEQHLTNTPCSAAINTTLNMGSCIPQENPKHITVETPST